MNHQTSSKTPPHNAESVVTNAVPPLPLVRLIAEILVRAERTPPNTNKVA